MIRYKVRYCSRVGQIRFIQSVEYGRPMKVKYEPVRQPTVSLNVRCLIKFYLLTIFSTWVIFAACVNFDREDYASRCTVPL